LLVRRQHVLSGIGEMFELDDDRDRVDVDALWRFLSRQAYWSRWRTRSDVEHQLAGAWRVVALYERPSGQMIAFARAVSDGIAVAYLADVYIEPRHRGRGLGTALVREMIDGGPAATHGDGHGQRAVGRGGVVVLGQREPEDLREAASITEAR
jgi:GNAT superfamily N-acetyltransferase